MSESIPTLDPTVVEDQSRPGFDRRAFLRRTALTGVAAGSVGTILSACGSSASSGSGSFSSVFRSPPHYKFLFVHPLTPHPFFTPPPNRLSPPRKPPPSHSPSTRPGNPHIN